MKNTHTLSLTHLEDQYRKLDFKKNMALVNVLDVNVLDNPSSFTNPFQFEITFECLKHLPSGTFSFRRARSFRLSENEKKTRSQQSQILSGKWCM